MRQQARAAWLLVALGMLVAIPAAASAATQVKIPAWKVQTSDGKAHKVSPGATFKACGSHRVDSLSATGKVHGAKKGKDYTEVWTAGAKRYATLPETWRESGSFRTTFGIGAEGFQPAKYKLKLVEGSKTIGKSSITIKTKKGC